MKKFLKRCAREAYYKKNQNPLLAFLMAVAATHLCPPLASGRCPRFASTSTLVTLGRGGPTNVGGGVAIRTRRFR